MSLLFGDSVQRCGLNILSSGEVAVRRTDGEGGGGAYETKRNNHFHITLTTHIVGANLCVRPQIRADTLVCPTAMGL
jgi:hypothetical protein